MIRYDDLKFSLPILFGSEQADTVMGKLINFTKVKYDIALPIHSYYGCTVCVWNGGRPGNPFNTTTNEYTKEYLLSVQAKGINIFLTFTSYLAGDYLDDVEGNKLLTLLSEITKGGDGVIVTDDRLVKYISTNYPKLKLKASLVKVTKEQPKVRSADYYNKLLSLFDIIVLHPDDNRNYELIGEINDISRVEVLIDERCTENCPIRDTHYNINAEFNQAAYDLNNNLIEETPVELLEKEAKLWAACPREQSFYMKNDKKVQLEILPNTNSELDILYDMGVRIFKTSGRGEYIKELYALNKFLDVAVEEENALMRLKYYL